MKKFHKIIRTAEEMLGVDTSYGVRSCKTVDDAKSALKFYLLMALSSAPKGNSITEAYAAFHKKASEFLAALPESISQFVGEEPSPEQEASKK